MEIWHCCYLGDWLTQGFGTHKPNQKKYFIFIRWSLGSVLRLCSCFSHSLFAFEEKCHDCAICLSALWTFLQQCVLPRFVLSGLGEVQQIQQDGGAGGGAAGGTVAAGTAGALPTCAQALVRVRALLLQRVSRCQAGWRQGPPSSHAPPGVCCFTVLFTLV